MESQFQLTEFLPYRITRLAERVSRSLAGVYADRFGISVPQWRVLATVHEFPGLAATVVAQRCNLDKVKVSRAVTALEQQGYLVRTRDDSDGRASHLHLSEEGSRLFSEIAPLAMEWEAELLADLGANERAAVADLLDRLEARASLLEKEH